MRLENDWTKKRKTKIKIELNLNYKNIYAKQLKPKT